MSTSPVANCDAIGKALQGFSTLTSRNFRVCPLSGHTLESALRGGRERAVCPEIECGFVHWDNPTPVVAAIVEHDNRVVLVRSIGRPANSTISGSSRSTNSGPGRKVPAPRYSTGLSVVV